MKERFAVIFPGQGSQAVGMLTELAKEFSIVINTYNQASEQLGYDLWHLTQEGPEEKLNQTEYTQPALLAAEISMWRIWKNRNNEQPAFLAGHSLGEYSALVCANAIKFEDAIKLVAERGRLMQSAVAAGEGGMAAIIGLDENEISEVCKKAAEGKILAPANYNSIGQIVISGHLAAVKRAIELANQAGAKVAKLLAVSVPSHCRLMKPAAAKLETILAEINIKQPDTPVINNADVLPYNNSADIRKGLVKQLYSPVRWVETIQFFQNQGLELLIECGPGKVLAGLNKRITKNLITIKIAEQLKR